MLRVSSIFAALAVLAPLAPEGAAIAQPAATAEAGEQRCENRAARRRGSSMLGGLAGRALGRAGLPSSVGGVSLPTESLLSDAIMNLLDCRERQQAAAATNEAIRGGVGTTTSWQSETRPGVSGTSNATAEDRLADGTHCMTITNIVIVDGEETRAPQRMCRSPGARGYARV
jgi:hypothetical protein